MKDDNNIDDRQLSTMLESINAATVNKINQRVSKMGTPIFDSVEKYNSQHPLDQLIRSFIDENNITVEEFKHRHISLHNKVNMPINKGNTERSNILRSLTNSNITWNTFERILHICGFAITDIKVTIQEKDTGSVSILSRSDIQERMLQDMRPVLVKYAGGGVQSITHPQYQNQQSSPIQNGNAHIKQI